MQDGAQPTQLWFTRCPVPTPLGIAGQLGWLDEAFAEDGITIRSVKDSGDAAVMRSHYDHHLPWSFRHGGSIPPLWARSTGRDTRLVGLTWADEFQALITLPETGIRTMRDLAGRRFGAPRRSDDIVDFSRGAAIKGLVSALAVEGMDPDAVEIVDVKNDDAPGLVPVGDPRLIGLRRRFRYFREVQALLRGEVDAIFVKAAQGVSMANFLGAHVISEFGFHPDPKIRINAGTPRTLTVDARFVEERPDLVDKLVLQVLRAGAWARQNRETLLRTISKEAYAIEDAVVVAMGRDFHLDFGLGLDPDRLAALSYFKDFLVARGILKDDFDISSWVDPGPLDRARHALG